MLKQPPFAPLPVYKQILIIYAGNNGFLDDLPNKALKKYEEELYKFIETKYPDIFQELKDKKAINDELKSKMEKALEEFKTIFKA